MLVQWVMRSYKVVDGADYVRVVCTPWTGKGEGLNVWTSVLATGAQLYLTIGRYRKQQSRGSLRLVWRAGSLKRCARHTGALMC